ncbi:MAG: endonuclease MutS2 [Hydrogenibacillus sp.]|nr:endonuclease MutS2 [Hydrogenibacillus sp.]
MDARTLTLLEYEAVIEGVAEAAATPLGADLARALRPAWRREAVEERLAETDEALVLLERFGPPDFSGIGPIDDAVDRAVRGGLLYPDALYRLLSLMIGARRVRGAVLRIVETVDLPRLSRLAEAIQAPPDLYEALRGAVASAEDLRDDASPTLEDLRRRIRALEARIRETLERMVRDSEFQKALQEPVVMFRAGRAVLPVRADQRGRIKGIVHDVSGSGATLFVEPEAVVALNNERRALETAEAREVERILRRLTAAVADHAEALRRDEAQLAALDFALAKAAYARRYGHARPMMEEPGGRIALYGAYHPLLFDRAVKNDIVLEDDVRLLLITGPNTGGKTVTLKTVGLAALMAQSGLFIPADEGSRLPVFDGVYADIGDEQSIAQNLSTFSSHMVHVVEIMRRATAESLVLLDEIGAGTDPQEGVALAAAVLEALAERGTRIVATTHYSELKALAYERPWARNASVAFDRETLRPTYRLLLGVPGASHALYIARRLGLEETVVERARARMSEGAKRSAEIVQDLSDRLQSLEAEHARLAAERARVEEARRALEAELAAQRAAREARLQEIEASFRRRLEEAVRRADMIVAELQSLHQAAQTSPASAPALKPHEWIARQRTLKEVLKGLDGAAEQGAGRKAPDAQSADRVRTPLLPGTAVQVRTYGAKGTVLEVRPDGEAVVQLGLMKLTVPVQDLLSLETQGNASSKTPGGSSGVRVHAARRATFEIDVRGMTVKEAEAAIDEAIDRALLDGLDRLVIVHGLGTGALKRGVAQFLSRHPAVLGARSGGREEGGSGVTIVEL